MRLLVVRHAIALDRTEHARLSSSDDDRPLTAQGADKMRINAAGLARILKNDAAPDVLFSSPLTRAEQTASILVREIWPGLKVIKRDELKPSLVVDDAIALIGDFAHKNRRCLRSDLFMVVVGHEPHLSRLVSHLLTGAPRPLFGLRKGGACLLTLPKGSVASRAYLEWYLRPKQMRQICRR